MASQGKINKKIKLTGVIKAETGLHIGGTNVGMAIGGADNTVVRNPISNQPYIPGSSLKGKMRSLLEKLEGKIGEKQDNTIINGPYHLNVNDPICLIFGTLPEKIRKQINSDQPVSRLIVRDCPLTQQSARQLEGLKSTDMPFTEVKTEVVIDRITSSATPRQLERVPAGAEFELGIILNIYEGDDEKMLLEKIFQSLQLVQDDYLGGKGTRGSGQVSFRLNPLKYKSELEYQGNSSEWKDYSLIQIPNGIRS